MCSIIDVLICTDETRTILTDENHCHQNVFIHFEPLGHTLQHKEANTEDEDSLEYLYQKARKKLQTKCGDDNECKASLDLNVDHRVPPYILPGSEEERRWLQAHPKARVVSFTFGTFTVLGPNCFAILITSSYYS